MFAQEEELLTVKVHREPQVTVGESCVYVSVLRMPDQGAAGVLRLSSRA